MTRCLPSTIVPVLLALSLPLLGGCTAEQAYSGGQAWQRTECNRLPDGLERTRCLERADTSYETYRKDKEAAEARKY